MSVSQFSIGDLVVAIKNIGNFAPSIIRIVAINKHMEYYAYPITTSIKYDFSLEIIKNTHHWWFEDHHLRHLQIEDLFLDYKSISSFFAEEVEKFLKQNL